MVVDDSAFMRSELTRIIEADPQFKVIAVAENGEEAIRKVARYTPDVLTMDINMPVMDGISALEIIMKTSPCPIIMISALTVQGAEETMDALALGAVDFIHKPSGSISLDISLQASIIRKKLKAAAYSKPIGRKRPNPWSGMTRKKVKTPVKQSLDSNSRNKRIATIEELVGIGVSTGGPRTLASILPQIPDDFSGSIVVVQHMPEKFTGSFARRLDGICNLKVTEARDGEILQAGRIYIAPGGKHIRVNRWQNRYYAFEIVEDFSRYTYVPSVELFFRSLLSSAGNRWLGIMLTGMGSDGAHALTELKKMGGQTIAEAEESCVVFGMPRKVIEMGGANHILNENLIAGKILELSGYQHATGN